MSKRSFAFAFAAALALGAGATHPLVAQDAMPGMDHSKMDHSNMPPSTMAYMQGMERMMKDMMVPYTGNADVDFVRGMIPHHQGAIDMAKVVLEHGKNPEIRKLAEDIIKAQEGEIAWMQDWLTKNPAK
jgi:uncharacterized protein (DUF305 family)